MRKHAKGVSYDTLCFNKCILPLLQETMYKPRSKHISYLFQIKTCVLCCHNNVGNQ